MASHNDDTRPSVAGAPTCPFLDKTPPEIRNNIYDLVFAPSDPTAAIELKDAQPPAKDIILTCGKVHSEAAAMFKSAYRAFWSESKFLISLSAAEGQGGAEQAKAEAEQEKQYRAVVNGEGIARNIAHIKHITVNGATAKFVLVDGVWEATHSARSCRDFRPRRMLPTAKDQRAVLRDAGYKCPDDQRNVLICTFNPDVTPESFQAAVRLAGKRNLTVEDLEAVLLYFSL